MAKIQTFVPKVPPMPRRVALTVNQILEAAFTAHDRGDRAQAEKGYLEVLKRDQNNPALWYGMGRLAMESTDFEEGAIRFNRAIAFGFNQPIAFVRLAWCLQSLGRFDQALTVLKDAESLAPEDPAHAVNQAVVLGQLERWDESLLAAQRALALREEYLPALLNAGAALVHLGREPEALSHFEKALVLDPENSEIAENIKALKA